MNNLSQSIGRYLLILFTAIGFSACTDTTAPIPDDETVNVNIAINLPSSVQSRAYGDGSGAKTLIYAVYEENKFEYLFKETIKNFPDNNTISIPLTTGVTYNIVFWAQNPDADCYNFEDNGSITINYSSLMANDETLDAFFANKKLTVSPNQTTQTISLKRPFAQINIGTSDLNELDKDISTLKSSISVRLPSNLNLIDGTVSATKDVDYTFHSSAIPQSAKFPVDKYEYLCMTYILCGDGKSLLPDLTFKVIETDENNPLLSKKISNLSVQRNYRTNIYGALFSNPTEFVISIAPQFDGDDPSSGTVTPVDPENPEDPNNPNDPSNITRKDTATKTYYVNSIDDLRKALSDDLDVREGGWTVKLTTNLDLNNTEVDPIRIPDEYASTVIFDGGNYTISNVVLNTVVSDGGKKASSLFYSPKDVLDKLTVKNLNIKNLTAGDGDTPRSAVIAPYFAGTIENVHISNATLKAQYPAGFISQIPNSDQKQTSIKGCSITESQILCDLIGDNPLYDTATSGGIIAYISNVNSGTSISILDCSVTNCTFRSSITGAYIGRISYPQYPKPETSFVGSTFSGNVLEGGGTVDKEVGQSSK